MRISAMIDKMKTRMNKMKTCMNKQCNEVRKQHKPILLTTLKIIAFIAAAFMVYLLAREEVRDVENQVVEEHIANVKADLKVFKDILDSLARVNSDLVEKHNEHLAKHTDHDHN